MSKTITLVASNRSEIFFRSLCELAGVGTRNSKEIFCEKNDSKNVSKPMRISIPGIKTARHAQFEIKIKFLGPSEMRIRILDFSPLKFNFWSKSSFQEGPIYFFAIFAVCVYMRACVRVDVGDGLLLSILMVGGIFTIIYLLNDNCAFPMDSIN
jgi:hypothetical protein